MTKVKQILTAKQAKFQLQFAIEMLYVGRLEMANDAIEMVFQFIDGKVEEEAAEEG